MENLVIQGQITATSNKVDGKYKQEVPTKTAYLKVTDKKQIKAMTDFGLTHYTPDKPDENGQQEPFFIIKLVQNVKIYVTGEKDEKPETMRGTIETPNFKTNDNVVVNINILKAKDEERDKEFYRIQAIKINSSSDIEELTQENPFA